MTTVSASIKGRNLALALDGIDEPFIIPPLPGSAGHQITATYLAKAHPLTSEEVSDAEVTEALMIAVDGGLKDAETGRWAPREAGERPVWDRVQAELQLSEAADVIMPAFLWQTVLGGRGVTAYFEAGGGDAGMLRGLLELVARLGIGGAQVSPSETVSAHVTSGLASAKGAPSV